MKNNNILEISNIEVKDKFLQYPKKTFEKLFYIRSIIFEIASKNKEIGAIKEILRWGEPSYITSETNSGSIISRSLNTI